MCIRDRDIVLEPAQIEVPNYHWGQIAPGGTKNRRAVRSLLVPFVMADVPESVNAYSWEIGKIVEGLQIAENTEKMRAMQEEG